MHLTKLLPNKQYYLIASLQKKNHLRIHAFLANSSKVKRNIKALLMNNTLRLDNRVRKKILSSINKNLDTNQSIIMKDWVI